MKIGILGSGIVGKTLAGGFIKHGFQVMAGSRDPKKISSWKEEISNDLHTGKFSEAAVFGELIVLATKGSATEEAVKVTGPENLSGKVIIDTTNPIADTPPVNGVLKFFTSLDQSLMEKLQIAVPDAYFVKAFSCVGSPFMVNPDFGPEKPTMFICGNQTEAKKTVSDILHKFGWEVEDMGLAEAARAIEPLSILWCIPGLRENNWNHAFRLLKK